MSPRSIRTDGEATRNRILEVAGALFASAGYGATTGKEIAARAGTSLASINYHFGSRSGLYEAVLVEAHRRLVDVAQLQALAGSDASASDRLAILIGLLVRQATKRRPGWHLRVLAREVLAPSSHLQILLQSALVPKLVVVRPLLGAIAGIAPDDPALTRCLVSVFAPCLMMLIGPRTAPGPLQEVLRSDWQVIAAHMHRFAVAGLAAIGQDRRRPSAAAAPSPAVHRTVRGMPAPAARRTARARR